jgi:hypothetical protein
MMTFQKITLMILIIAIILVSGCTTNIGTTAENKELNSNGMSSSIQKVERIEVYHFHATQQCYSCKTVGEYAEETVNTYFADELKSGKISFASFNVDDGFNMEIAKKYGATGSSLWIGVYDANGFHPEQNTNVWYKINDKEDYMNYLKGIIDKRLEGDYS